jgi:3-oxoacyl-[acyl-carrier protein] reductase
MMRPVWSPDAAQVNKANLENPIGKLDGKVALVTGATKGIGAGVALSLAKGKRAAVAVNYASYRAGADDDVEKIRVSGGKPTLSRVNKRRARVH